MKSRIGVVLVFLWGCGRDPRPVQEPVVAQRASPSGCLGPPRWTDRAIGRRMHEHLVSIGNTAAAAAAGAEGARGGLVESALASNEVRQQMAACERETGHAPDIVADGEQGFRVVVRADADCDGVFAEISQHCAVHEGRGVCAPTLSVQSLDE